MAPFHNANVTRSDTIPTATRERHGADRRRRNKQAVQRRNLIGSLVCGEMEAPFKPNCRTCIASAVSHNDVTSHTPRYASSTKSLLQQPVRQINNVVQFEQSHIWTLAKRSVNSPL